MERWGEGNARVAVNERRVSKRGRRKKDSAWRVPSRKKSVEELLRISRS